MSADAKVWRERDGWWRGVHDGTCRDGCFLHAQGEISLTRVLEDIERCVGGTYQWEFRHYPDGEYGLVGYRC